MRDVVVSATARSELRNITSCLASFGSVTARSFARELDRKVASLREGVVEYPYARHPELAAAGYRVALVKSYLLLYKVNPDGSVGIAHVFHQSQDYASLVTEIR